MVQFVHKNNSTKLYPVALAIRVRMYLGGPYLKVVTNWKNIKLGNSVVWRATGGHIFISGQSYKRSTVVN